PTPTCLGLKALLLLLLQELKRSTPSKDSIAMENPAYVATQKEVSTSKFSEKHVKRVTPGERQTLL
uniref:Uncharacterized protein n=1 Tax=Aegilops tauschii subsp. strangulata TaxID=200361 RepID=A0A453ESB3_AEGTS